MRHRIRNMRPAGIILRLTLVLLICFCAAARAQSYAIGADVSFLGNAEQHGVIFKDHGIAKPCLEILKDHGYNWIRLRIFVHPTVLPNNLPYTIALAKQAKKLGYKFLLDFHYSDTWADPGKQFIPAAWQRKTHAELVLAVFDYTRDTIGAFRDAGVLPDMVQIGNEVTNGMLWPDGKLPENWDHFAELVQAGINGVDAGRGNGVRPKIMIHIDRGGDSVRTKAFFDKLLSYGISFDVIGLAANAPVKLPEWNKGAHSHGFPRLRLILAEQARPAAIGRAKILTAIPHQFCYSLICHAHLEKFARPDVLPTSKPGKPHSLEGRMFCLCGLCGALGTRNFNLEKDRA